MGGEILKAKYEGKSYEIPAMWMIGYCRNGRTPLDAIKWWAYQAELEIQWQAQRAGK